MLQRLRKIRWYMWATVAFLLGVLLSVLVSGCNTYVAMLPADFDHVQRIVEDKVAQLAPESGAGMMRFQPISIQRWSVWYEDRQFQRDVDPGKRARYRVEATRYDGIEDTSRVRCNVEIRKTSGGVRLRCSGKPWNTSFLSFESSQTRWYGPRFIEEVKEELPYNPEHIVWGAPTNGLKLGVVLGQEQGEWFKNRSLLIYLQNMKDEPLRVCPRMDPLARWAWTESHKYVLDLSYVDTKGNRYSGVPEGDSWASGFTSRYWLLKPGPPLLIGRGDLRLGAVRRPKEYEMRSDALPPSNYRLVVTLKAARRENELSVAERSLLATPAPEADQKIPVWEGSVEATTGEFIWAGKSAPR